MGFSNVVDESEVVSASSAGIALELKYRTTKRRSLLGVPVRLVISAEASIAGDTGAVKLLDAAAAEKLVIPITKAGENIYAVDGYLPAAAGKYDLHGGGNIDGSLKVFAWSLFELMDIGPNAGALTSTIGPVIAAGEGRTFNAGELAASIGDVSVVADGTVASVGSGSLDATIAPITVSADATRETHGSATPTIAPVTVSADATRETHGSATPTISAVTSSATGTVASTWTVDASSGKGFPANATEWAAVLAAAGVSIGGGPSHIYLFQEASGSLIDQVGSLNLALNVSANYAEVTAGQSRKSIGGDGVTLNQGFTANGGVDPSTTSFVRFSCLRLNGATNSQFFYNGTSVSNVGVSGVSGSSKIRVRNPGGLSDSVNSYGGIGFFPLVEVWNNTTPVHAGYTHLETWGPTKGTATSANKYTICCNNPWTNSHTYEACFEGAVAEALGTAANIKAVLQTLGWAISGY